MRTLPLLAAVVLAACATSDEEDLSGTDGKADGIDSATIDFHADGSFTAPVRVVTNHSVTVRYPVAGRAVCRDGGEEALQAFYSFEGSGPTAFHLDHVSADGRTMIGTIVIPDGLHLSLWFRRVDINGNVTCWDSNHGHNFVVPILPDFQHPTLVFDKDTVLAWPHLVGGKQGVIRYAMERNPCLGGTLEAFVQGDGQQAQSLGRPESNPSSHEFFYWWHFNVPEAHHLSVWFRATGEGSPDPGCVTWDSHGGHNFVFPVSAQ